MKKREKEYLGAAEDSNSSLPPFSNHNKQPPTSSPARLSHHSRNLEGFPLKRLSKLNFRFSLGPRGKFSQFGLSRVSNKCCRRICENVVE